MRFESSVTSVSWIPSEGIDLGSLRMPFDTGVLHYDPPLPDRLEDLDALQRDDRFRFANHLAAWIEVDGSGAIAGHGFSGRGLINHTRVRVGGRELSFQPAAFRPLQRAEVSAQRVRFVQTTGGRTGLPAPRRVRRPPFVQWAAPTVWTTLALTIGADGSSASELLGASPFPRHWIYGPAGELVAKSGLLDFEGWYRHAFGRHTPWGDEDSPALVAEASSALERELSATIMHGGRPVLRTLEEGDVLVTQGEPGHELFLLLDGMLQVEVDGDAVAELGPGAVVGERALLEGGRRTSTLRALTRCRVAVAPGESVDREVLVELSGGHRRENGSPGG